MERVVCVDYGLRWDFQRLQCRRDTSCIIIHHTAGAETDNAALIHRFHSEQYGWAGIGYHYLIGQSGLCEIGRPRDAVGAHAEGYNQHSVGVALIGNFSNYQPSRAQIENLSMLCANICNDYGIEPSDYTILGHRDVDSTECPGDYLYEILPDIIGKTLYYMYGGE